MSAIGMKQDAFLPRGWSQSRGEPNSEFKNPFKGEKQTSEWNNFGNKTDEEVIEWLEQNMFTNLKKLEDGSWVGLTQLLTTMSVCCDITPISPYTYRWCFRNPEEAFAFLEEITEFDQVPTQRKSLVGHRFSQYGRLLKYDENGFKAW